MPWAALFPWLRVSSQQLAYVWPGPGAGTVLVGGMGSSGSACPVHSGVLRWAMGLPLPACLPAVRLWSGHRTFACHGVSMVGGF